MDEAKFRKAIQTFFREYEKVTDKMDKLVAKLGKKTPVPPEDRQRAHGIFDEELESSRLLPEVKAFLREQITPDSFN